jgi:hypothetical protein
MDRTRSVTDGVVMHRRLFAVVCSMGAVLARTYGRTGWADFVIRLGELEAALEVPPNSTSP